MVRLIAQQVLGRALAIVSRGRVVWAAADNDDALHRAIARADLVSFDIFDTAIVRPLAAPTHLFWLLGTRLKQPNFRAARLRAEDAARRQAKQRGMDEVTLEEIYASLSADLRIDSDRGAAWMRSEIELEQQVCRAHPFVHKIYESVRAQGKQIAFASDSYLPADTVRALLERNGYPDFRLFVSSESRQTKARGGLFKLLAKTVGVDTARILHIGDTFRPDIVQPLRAGLAAAHLVRPIDAFLKDPRLRRQITPIENIGHSLLLGLLANRQPHDPGYHVLGPLCAALSLKVKKKMQFPAEFRHLDALWSQNEPSARQFLQDLKPFHEIDPELKIPARIATALAKRSV